MILDSKHQVSNILADDHKILVDGVRVERVSVARNLGVLMEERLLFEQHISEMVLKFYYMLKILYRICAFTLTKIYASN